MKSNQILKIFSKIKIDNNIESESFSYPCSCKKVCNNILLHYIETSEGGNKTDCLIKIHSDCVEIKKSGVLGSHMVFSEAKKTDCLYKTPYGTHNFTIETLSYNTVFNNNIKIMLKYNIYEKNTLLGYYDIEMEVI